MDIEADDMAFENIDITDVKHVLRRPYRHRRCIIFVTIDDAQISLVDIEKMMEVGMNVARFKIAQYSKSEKEKLIFRFDKAAAFLAQKYGLPQWPCATCIELKSSVVQTGTLEQDVPYITIEADTEIVLTCDASQMDRCNEQQIYVDNPYISSDVTIGTELNMSQDEIIMSCTSIINDKSIKCIVTEGGRLKPMSYVCMRNGTRTRPLLSKKDYNLIKFAVEYQMNMIIVNYPREIETIRKIKKILGSKSKRPKIIAGICTEEGVLNIDEFIREADGILLSREFLAYEVDKLLYNRMFLIQSYICGKCRQAGKPLFISGGVFDMTLGNSSHTTREISDVTNAILQGVSGFTIGNSTSISNVIDVIKLMNDVCASVEPLTIDRTAFWQLVSEIKMPVNAAEASAMSCAVVANQTNARCIIVPTVTGCTAYLLTWLQPNSIVIAVTTKIRTLRLLKTYRSVTPLLYKGSPRRTWSKTVQARVDFAIQYAVEKQWIKYADHYVTLEKGSEESSFCDTVRIWTVIITQRNTVECPESYHDFNINLYLPLPVDDKKGKHKKRRKKNKQEVIKEEDGVTNEEGQEKDNYEETNQIH